MNDWTSVSLWWWPMIAVALGIAGAGLGGALSGLVIARRELGVNLAVVIGALYGVSAGVPGIALGLILVMLLR